VLVVLAAEFPSNKLLNGATSPEEFLRAHAFNAVKGLATEKDLGATKLETSNGTARSKIELHKLLVVFGASDLVALSAITLLLSLGPLCLRGHYGTLDSKRVWRSMGTPVDLVVGIRAGLHDSIVGDNSKRVTTGLFDLELSLQDFVINLPQVVGDLGNEALQLLLLVSIMRRDNARREQWRLRSLVDWVSKDVRTSHENIVRVASGVSRTTDSDSF
jgi:hypothetical protein